MGREKKSLSGRPAEKKEVLRMTREKGGEGRGKGNPLYPFLCERGKKRRKHPVLYPRHGGKGKKKCFSPRKPPRKGGHEGAFGCLVEKKKKKKGKKKGKDEDFPGKKEARKREGELRLPRLHHRKEGRKKGRSLSSLTAS